MAGIFGLPDQVWKRAITWNDYYLLNNHPNTDNIYTDNTDMSLIILNTMNGKEIEKYKLWSDIASNTVVYELKNNEKLDKINELNNQLNDDTIINSFVTGKEAGISGGIAYLSSTIEAIIDVQKPIFMHHIDRKHAAVFRTSRHIGEQEKYRGIPILDLNFIPQSTNGTFIIYLLGVDELNWGHLFTFSPWTFKNVVPNQKNSISIPITVTCYDIPSLYDLAIVIAAKDSPLYLDQNPSDQTIKFLSGSKLTVPYNNK